MITRLDKIERIVQKGTFLKSVQYSCHQVLENRRKYLFILPFMIFVLQLDAQIFLKAPEKKTFMFEKEEISYYDSWASQLRIANATVLKKTVTNGVPQLGGFGESVFVKTRRAAAWLQEEWDPNPNWSASAGVRWEEIRTRSFDESAPLENTSRVVNPLAHVVWRFDAPKRDQARASLTQSYRSPTTQNLVSRPRLNTQDPVPGGNQPTSADSAGNPTLKAEIANGLELAYESYLTQNGVVSVDLFTRRLKDVIRNVTALETVSWAPVPRWVRQRP